MNNDYIIQYVDHRRDPQRVNCSAFEDAEAIAQFIANRYGKCTLFDGTYSREYYAALWGCFYRCKIFQGPAPSHDEAVELYR